MSFEAHKMRDIEVRSRSLSRTVINFSSAGAGRFSIPYCDDLIPLPFSTYEDVFLIYTNELNPT